MNLEANYGGLKLKNPMIVASATPTTNLEGLKKSVDCGAGAFVTKSIIFPKAYYNGMAGYKPGDPCAVDPRPRFHICNKDIEFDPALHARGAYYSMFNMIESYPRPEEWADVMETIKAYCDIPVIVSICAAEHDYDEWQKIAKVVENMGADAIELSGHHMPYTAATDPLIVKAVKEAVKVPVIAKPMFPPEDPVKIAKALAEMGADGITAIGNQSIKGMEVDVESESIVMQPTHYTVRGPWWRPVGLNWITQMSRTVDLPLSGVTGIANWRDVVKYILCGASTTQVCTALYVDGYEAITKMLKGLEKWMAAHNYNSLDDFRGKVSKQWVSPVTIPYNTPVGAKVEDDCIGCGICTKTCFFDAITVEDKKVYIDPGKCEGCGVCVSVCPSKAVSFGPF